MSTTRAVWRLGRVALQAAAGALTCAVVFPFLTPARRMQRVGRWSAGMMRALGIAVHASGASGDSGRPGPALLVANHVSWLDILAINAVRPVRFVSKADVRHWPLVGWMAMCGGTLFIERERKRDALRVVHQVADALRQGETVAIFPEGTTSDGHGVLPFHANLLQAAVATATPVQAVVLCYSDSTSGSGVSADAAYVGDTTLLESLWRVAGARGLRVEVRLLEPVAALPELGRRQLAELLRSGIEQALQTR